MDKDETDKMISGAKSTKFSIYQLYRAIRLLVLVLVLILVFDLNWFQIVGGSLLLLADRPRPKSHIDKCEKRSNRLKHFCFDSTL